MDWEDTSRAIAYFKEIDEAHLLEKYCLENNLLFEIELDAVKAH